MKALAEKRVMTDPMAFVQDQAAPAWTTYSSKVERPAKAQWHGRKSGGTGGAALDAPSPLKVLGRGRHGPSGGGACILESGAGAVRGSQIVFGTIKRPAGCQVDEKEEDTMAKKDL